MASIPRCKSVQSLKASVGLSLELRWVLRQVLQLCLFEGSLGPQQLGEVLFLLSCVGLKQGVLLSPSCLNGFLKSDFGGINSALQFGAKSQSPDSLSSGSKWVLVELFFRFFGTTKL